MYNRLQNIGSNVKKLRKKKKLSQIELAVVVGIDRSYLSEIENGRANMSVSVLYAVADSLGVDIAELFKNNE